MVAPLGVGSAQNATTATLDSEGFLAYAHGGSAAKVLEHASLNDWQYTLSWSHRDGLWPPDGYACSGSDLNFVGHISTRSETFKSRRARLHGTTLVHGERAVAVHLHGGYMEQL